MTCPFLRPTATHFRMLQEISLIRPGKRTRTQKRWVGAFILLAIFSAICNEKQMTPEQTITKYFEYWNSKNLKGMNTLTGSQGTEYFLERQDYVKLNKISECSKAVMNCYKDDTKRFLERPYKIRYLCVNFDYKYKPGMGGPMNNANYNWTYCLTKEKPNGRWVIRSWGFP
jgi:hypothetical protein